MVAGQRYMVTGCAGFIGARVTEMLLEQGCEVIGVDNLNNAYDTRLKEWRLARLVAQPGFVFKQADIVDSGQLQDLEQSGDIEGVQGVVNLAARAGVRESVIDPWVYYDTNVTGTLNLLDVCRRHKIEKFVLASSSSLYGASAPIPFAEEAGTDAPLSPYSASKKAAEGLCHVYHHLHGVDISILRYFTVYGPAGRPEMSAFRFVQWIFEERPATIYGDGTQRRDFTYIDDIARGTVAALKPLGYEIINLGSNSPVDLKEFIALVEGLVGKKAKCEYTPAHAADMDVTWADITKAKQLLDWQPQVPFTEGIERLVEWYQQNRDWAKEIATR